MIQADPSHLPYFSDPQTSRISLQNTEGVSYSLFIDFISKSPTKVLALFNK